MTMTTAGMEAIAGYMVADVSAGWCPLGWISIGTHATVPTTSDTTMGGPHPTQGAQEANATGTVDFSSVPSMKFTNTYSFTGAGSIAEAGISSGVGSSVTLVSHVTFSHVSVTASDTLAITYYLQVIQG